MKNLNLSFYTIPVKLTSEPGKYMLVHGYTGAIDIVDEKIWAEMCDETLRRELPENSLLYLKERGYLTEKITDEEVNYVIKLADLLHRSQCKLFKSFGFVVSYDCNFRCPYCFENEISDHGLHWSKRAFTKEMVDKVYDAMLKIEPRSELHLKRILLYGGEPFLRNNIEIVKYIILRGRSLGYTFKAITNGYDLNYFEDVLTPENFSFLQITLDGFVNTHNARRYHFIEGDSFNRIIDNVEILLEKGIDVHLRVNTDENNFSEFSQLKALFSKRGFDKNPHFMFYSSILREYGINKESSGGIKYIASEEKFNEEHIKVYNGNIDCQDMGIYRHFLHYLKTGKKCRLYSESCSSQYGGFLFDPIGNIFPCLDLVGKKEFVIGRYDKELNWTDIRNHWHSRNVGNLDNCKKCRFALLCGGGCLAHVPHNEKGFFPASYCTNYKSIFPLSLNRAYEEYKNNLNN